MDHALVFEGKLVTFNISGDKDSELSALNVSCLSLHDGQTLNEDKKIVFQIKTNRRFVQILQTTVCREITTELTIPVLLVHIANQCKTTTFYLFALNFAREKIVPLRKIVSTNNSLNHHVDINNTHFQIADGPSLVWTGIKHVYYSGWTEKEDLQFSPIIIASDLHNPEILWTAVKDNLSVFLIRSVGKEGNPKHTAYIRDSDIEGKENLKEMNISFFYPKEYSNIIYVHITDFQIKKNEGGALVCAMSLLAMTSEGCLLSFVSGRLTSASPVYDSALNPEGKVDIFKWSPHSCNKTFAAIKIGTVVTIFDICSKKVQCSWSDITNCLLGDLLSLGTKQLLLLKKHFNGEVGWILTDENSVLIDNSSDELSQGSTQSHQINESSADKGDNSAAAVDALQARLQNELVQCCEAEREMERKQTFIDKMWKRLQHMVEGRQLQKPCSNSYLLPLIGKPTKFKSSMLKFDVLREENHHPKVTDTWQRIVEDKWIVGLDLNFNRPVVSSKLSVIPVISASQQTGGLVCLSQLTHFGSSSRDTVEKWCDRTIDEGACQPSAKRRRIHPAEIESEVSQPCAGSMFSLLKLPQFRHQTEFKCHLIVDWTESLTNDVLDKTNPGCSLARHSLGCGVISLSVDDVLKGKYDVKVSETVHNDKGETTSVNPLKISRDITSLNLAQLSIPLTVVSSCSKVSQLNLWLEQRAEFMLSPSYECHVAPPDGPLCGVRIIVDNGLKQDYAKFTLYTRDEDQAILVVHHLYSRFPDDVLILPDKHSKTSAINRNVAAKLEEELTFLISSVREFTKGDNTQMFDGVSHEEEKDEKGNVNVDKVRENFSKRKRSLLENVSWNADEQTVVKMTKILDQLCLRTDEAVVKLNSSQNS